MPRKCSRRSTRDVPSPAAPSDPDLTGDERTLLTQFLDYQRTVMLRKIGELDDDGLRKVMTPSGLTLLGMLKHLAFVERWWFRVVFAGEQGIDPPWTDADPDADWRVEPGETSEDIRALFDDEVARASRSRRRRRSTPSRPTRAPTIARSAGSCST